MSEIVKHQMFKQAQRDAARQALAGLSDRERVHFALALMMEVTDPDAQGVLRFASNQLTELTNRLIQARFEQECA